MGVGVLEEKLHVNQNNDVDELVKQQKRVDEAITANTVAILKIDEEINVLSNSVKQKSSMEAKVGTSRKCRHYNRGHCKHKGGCDFSHPKEICQDHLNGKKCDNKDCVDRHPKVCKYWLKSNAGCKRGISCDFLHVTLACHDGNVNSIDKVETHDYKCVGCESSWTDKRCVINHTINNQQVYFCLNCDDWVRDKSKVLDT